MEITQYKACIDKKEHAIEWFDAAKEKNLFFEVCLGFTNDDCYRQHAPRAISFNIENFIKENFEQIKVFVLQKIDNEIEKVKILAKAEYKELFGEEI